MEQDGGTSMRLEDRIGDWYEQEIEMDRFQMAREE
eukprot:CAMPEP_0206135322 /NCGR_PEP_ID=MMETSP1473-20131121/639_1 /ASSEMBLY_ACC=CAM_ASM_001109 /TAXON_ID=1461547 /ORGANISM="Stichococcus sp, Strain RCC1054" /LENGTH=34 /DNA_ID= /DNA_START= /DNA_END= /DNA_ORIENTATION=